ncbi:MAG: hypothetical protein FWF23_04580 [Alphaproteobacteria bacterium]|nr:hypothetical protein [Alphaproteobacteria bacterium]MCL2505346.1 hypothetical protein [Alphaproteobacteria bacterium]
MKKIVMMLVVGLLVCACSEPKIDATNEDTMRSSLEKVQQSLSPEQKAQFDEAFAGILSAAAGKQLLKVFSEEAPSREDMYAEIKKGVDKKTAKQIIAEYEKMKKNSSK